MGTTAKLALPYPELTDTADVPRDIKNLADAIDLKLGNVGTSLPSTPADGQEFYYVADATNGVVWQLRYRSASGKWEFVGGAPLSSEVPANQGTTSTSFANLTTAGPLIALPLPGTYVADFGALIAPAATASASAVLGLVFGDGTTLISGGSEDTGGWAQAAVALWIAASRRMQVVSASAQDLRVKYKASTGTGQFRFRYLTVTPVRLG